MTTTEIRLTEGERIIIALHRADMTQKAFADFLGIDKATVWRWIHGRTPASLAALRVLAAEAGLPFEWLRPSPAETGEGLEGYAPGDSNPEPADLWSCLVMAVLTEAEEALGAIHRSSP